MISSKFEMKYCNDDMLSHCPDQCIFMIYLLAIFGSWCAFV